MATLAWNTDCFRSLRSDGPGSSTCPRLPRRVPVSRPSAHHVATLSALRASQQDPPPSSSVDVSIFRFTLGIPGFNDSDLPRVLGVAFGAVLVLNHFLTADYVTAAQLRSELVGLCNAVLSITLPLIGKSLNGSGSVDAVTSMPRSRQIFSLSRSLLIDDKEELAWGSYALLKNTRTTSVAIWNEGLVCIRGFWDVPNELKGDAMEWLEEKLGSSPLFTCKSLTYTPFKADKLGWDFIPAGVVCSLIVPLDGGLVRETNTRVKVKNAYLLLLSSTPNAFSQKDLLWIQWLAKKLLKPRSNFLYDIKV